MPFPVSSRRLVMYMAHHQRLPQPCPAPLTPSTLPCPLSSPAAAPPTTTPQGDSVTWGLVYYGDSLYSASDRQYESRVYTIPPDGEATGCIIRVPLGPQGQLLQTFHTFTQV